MKMMYSMIDIHPRGTVATARAIGPDPRPPLCTVRLVDRRSGQMLRVAGMPLTAISRFPHVAAAALMQGRDPALWQPRIDPITRQPLH